MHIKIAEPHLVWQNNECRFRDRLDRISM